MGKGIAVCLVLILGAAAGGGYWWWEENKAPERFKLYGNVDIRQVELAFQSPERLKTLYVEEGDEVKKGDVLADQDTDTLELQLKEAQAAEEAARQAYLILKTGSRPEEIAQAAAAVDAAKAQLVYAEADKKRAAAVYNSTKGRGVSEQQLDSAEANLGVAQADLVSKEKALELAKIGPRVEDVKKGLAQWQQTQAQKELIELKLRQSKLLAPLDAVVRTRYLQPGDMASSQKAVYSLAITSPKWIRAYVNEKDLGRIHPGQKAYVQIDTFPDRIMDGKVGFISSVAEFTPKTVETPDLRTHLVYEVRIITEDPKNVLRLGMPATVTFE